jgi:hypothetical protein
MAWPDRDDVCEVVGRSLSEAAMRAVLVVVSDVLVEQGSELAFVADDGPVEEFVAEGAHPSLRVRVGLWGAWWRPDGRDGGAGEDGVERRGEVSGAVADQEPESMCVGESHQQVANRLGGPRTGRVGGDSGEVDPSRGDFDDEEDVESAEACSVDAREVGRDDPGCLGANELRPGRSGAVTGRVDPCGAQDLSDRRGCDAVSESKKFAVDRSVTPGGVLACQSDDQSPEFGVDGWPSGCSGG